jgi:tripartite ATP-independent transporter DctP family solute receptor
MTSATLKRPVWARTAGTLGVSCLLALAAMAPAGAQTTMRNSISIGQNSHQGVGIDVFAKEIEKRTGGRYKIQNFYSGSLGGERESIEAVQLGTQELTLTSTGPVPNFVPEAKILDIPFLFRDYAQARAVLDGPIGQDLLQKFPAKGIVALAWGENGFRHMTNNKRQVVVPDDLKGLKMRTMENPVHMQAYKAFGIIPTPMAFTEVFTALQQGTVDGQENPITNISASSLQDVQDYISMSSHQANSNLVIIGADAWSGLSGEQQEALTAAVDAAEEQVPPCVAEDEEAILAEWADSGTMEVVDDVDVDAFRSQADEYFGDNFNADQLEIYEAIRGEAE